MVISRHRKVISLFRKRAHINGRLKISNANIFVMPMYAALQNGVTHQWYDEEEGKLLAKQ